MLTKKLIGTSPEESILVGLMRRLAVCALVLLLSAQTSLSAAAQQGAIGQQQESSSTAALPDSPAPAKADAAPQSQNPASNPTQPPDDSSKPVGTAAAPYMQPSGIAASRPAGAAIAPAKQRRAHSFVIKFALIAGAAAAGGAIVALSAGSRSRP